MDMLRQIVYIDG